MPAAIMNTVQAGNLTLNVNESTVNLSIVWRNGPEIPVLFLHGWGSSKEDFLDIQYLPHDTFRSRPFFAYDAPGCGQSTCSDMSQINIDFQVSTADKLLRQFDVRKVHLVGHSMGGLAALQLARRTDLPYKICSFTNIKGNLASEDCFLSRQITDFPSEDPEVFLEAFIERVSKAPLYSSALYASVLRQRVQTEAMAGIFLSMVQLSDHGDLMRGFLELEFPRTYMYGEQYANLSYLPMLKKVAGVELAAIPCAGHFPMYSNAVAMWDEIESCVKRGDEWDRCGLTGFSQV